MVPAADDPVAIAGGDGHDARASLRRFPADRRLAAPDAGAITAANGRHHIACVARGAADRHLPSRTEARHGGRSEMEKRP